MTTETVTEGGRPTRPRERQVSEFTALTRTVQEAGLMARRQGWYWTRFAIVLTVGRRPALVAPAPVPVPTAA